MILELKRARQLLERHGWVGADLEPWCRDGKNRPVHHHDDGVVRYSVSGALQCQGPAVLAPAWELFGQVVAPNLARFNAWLERYRPGPLTECYDASKYTELTARAAPSIWVDLAGEARHLELLSACEGEFYTFGGWLTQSGRTAVDVLAVFTAAIRTSKKTGERRG